MTRTPSPEPGRGGRGRRTGPTSGRFGAAPPCATTAASTPTRSSPTTSPTPPPRSPRRGPPSTYGALGDTEELLATAFVADVLADLVGRVAGREAAWGVGAGWSAPAADFLAARRDPAALAALADVEGPRHLGSDFELVRETFHRFAEEKVRPHAEHVHRTNGDIPEEIISGPGRAGRVRAVRPRGVRRLRHRRGERLHGHGGRHRGIELGIARHRRLPDHPARDPHPRPGLRRHRGAEEAVAAQAGLGGGAGGGGGHRARLRFRRRRHRHLGHPGRRWVADQRGQDLVHLRRPGRRADAAGPHRSRPLAGASRPLHVRGREATRRRARLRLRRRPAGDRPAGTRTRPARRAAPSTRSGTGGCTPTSCPSRTGSSPRPTWSAGPAAWGRASTSRCRASRMAACRRRPARWASCRPPTKRPPPMPPTARCSGRRSATTN